MKYTLNDLIKKVLPEATIGEVLTVVGDLQTFTEIELSNAVNQINHSVRERAGRTLTVRDLARHLPPETTFGEIEQVLGGQRKFTASELLAAAKAIKAIVVKRCERYQP